MDKSKIAEWHTLSKFALQNETINKRHESIENIIQRSEVDFWLDITRLYLGIEVNGKNINDFITSFAKIDDNFPLSRNEKLLKALAGMVLLYKIELANENYFADDEKSEEEETIASTEEVSEEEVDHSLISLIISNALVNSIFFNHHKIETKVPVIDTAKAFLAKYSFNQRTSEISEHEDKLNETINRVSEEPEELEASEQLNLVKASQAIIKENKLLSEEVNVLWWLFGEYSELTDKYFSEIEDNSMAVLSAKELYNLSKFNSELPAARQILRKAIKESKGGGTKQTSLKLCIDSLGQSLKEKILDSNTESIDILTPCLYALKNSNSIDWHKSIGFATEGKINHISLALQFYKEFIFINSIN